MKMKKYFSILLILALAFVFVGCVEKEITTDPNGEEIKFDETKVKSTVLRVWLDDTDGLFMDQLKPMFEAQNPGVKVQFQHMGTVDAREQLKIYGRANMGADIFQFPHDHMAQAILDDLVYVLPNTLKEKLEDRILPVAMDIATACYDPETGSFECAAGATKSLFAVPISIESVNLYYNKALVAAADLPTSFEDLIAKAKVFDAIPANQTAGNKYFQTSSHWGDSYFVQFAFGAFGWTPFGPELNDASEVGFEDAKAKAAIAWLTTQLKPISSSTSTPGNGTSKFEEGKLAFLLTGPWSVAGFKKNNINYGSIKIPTIKVDGVDKETRTYAGAQMVAVYKYTKQANLAFKFVEFLQSDEVAAIQYEVHGKSPALVKEIHSTIPGVKDDKVIEVMMKQLESSVPMPTIPEVTHYWPAAEAMLKAIWDSSKSIDSETTFAEKSYDASKKLASKK
jgi:arabinogalactan oligomer/maltooligosaccharide transport system substrate-binding protein